MTSLNSLVKDQSERVRFLVQYVRLQPFETITPEGRAQERNRRAALTTLTSVAVQGIKVLTSLVSVPLTLHYLGEERYGLWLTMSSLLAFVAFADLGIGNGLLNAISQAYGRNMREEAVEAVSTAFFLLSGIAILLGLLFAFAYPFIPWPRVFNVTSVLAEREAGRAMAVLFACFILNIVLGTIQRVQIGYQEGYRNNVWQIAGSLVGLAGVLIGIELEVGLPWLVLALAGAPVIATLLNGILLWGQHSPDLRPKWKFVSVTMGRKIANLGFMFLILQLAVAFAFSADKIVIAQILGPEAVVQFGVPQRLFAFVTMLVGFVLTPLWPAYGEATVRGDLEWVKRTLARSLRLSLFVVGPLALLMVVLGKPLVHAWVGSSIQPSFLLLLGFGLWAVISSVGNSLAIFLNGIGLLHFQVVTAIVMAGSNIALSIFLTYQYGLPGPIWGSVISYTLCSLIPTLIYVRRLFSKMAQTARAVE